jgi:polyhydroxyalkanoate synthesis regulator phasin
MSYKIGVSSGWWSIAKSEELLGLASKIGSTATYGVNFVQVDFESVAEFQEPDVIKNIKRMIDTLQVDWGMHGEIGEAMALESALEIVWKHSHRKLHQYLDTVYLKFFIEGDYREYLPIYIVFHASNLPTIGMIVESYRYAGQITVTPQGDTNWADFIKKNEKLKEWVEKSGLLYFLIAKESVYGFTSPEDIKRHIINWVRQKREKEIEEVVRKKVDELIETGKIPPEERTRIEDFVIKEEEKKIEKEVMSKEYEYAWEFFKEVTRLRFAEGAITYEDIAYLIVARYLFEERDNPNEPLWKLFFPKYCNENGWEEFEKEEVKLFDVKKGEVKLPPQIVAMVSAKYILDHFNEKNKEEFLLEELENLKKFLPKEKLEKIKKEFLSKTPFEKLAIINNLISEKVGKGKRKFMIVFENPEITRAGEEGLQRLIHAIDIYRMVKAAEQITHGIYLGMVFDQEHYLHNNLDPLNEIKSLENEAKDLGKFLLVFHVGAPKPYHPAHQPIDIGSEAQFWIYKYAFELKKLGFGVKDNEGIFIFERGGARGGQYPAQFIGQSAAALRIIIEFLEKNIEPEKLPLEFYGVSSQEILSEERQLAIIKEHFFDPLKGLLQVPEEEYTFLGSKAIEKGKRPEEWKKEELR